ncbi:MAG: phosphodiesterase [Pseudomonadota bacterium]
MARWLTAAAVAFRRAVGLPLHRLELFALFPLLAVAVAAMSNRPVAEVVGVVLPLLVMVDVIARPRPRLSPSTDDRPAGMPPRAALDEALARIALTPDRRNTACLAVRLDRLDHVARCWGGEGRDEVVRRTAERLRTALRPGDPLARIDDTTFGILLRADPHGRGGTAMVAAERILAAISEPIAIGGGTARVSASVGIATPPDVPLRDLAKCAEAAVAEAQSLRPGTIRYFSQDLQARLDRAAELRASVERAFASGEIRAWFQPQICTDTGQISGFEALARWHHPTLGVLAPGQFLDAVGGAGRMSHLGQTMLTQALTALAAWDRHGLRIPGVSVNFSAEELSDPSFPDRMKWEVDRFDLRPGRVIVEILESVAAHGDDDLILRNIDQLASHGFNIDLDDFGTGQASIQNIRRFRAGRIKIDRSFVTGIDRDPEQQAVVAAILSMAQHLGVGTLAEGIETPAEHTILALLGCDHIQGFGVSRPMRIEDSFGWIETYRARSAEAPQIGRRAG